MCPQGNLLEPHLSMASLFHSSFQDLGVMQIHLLSLAPDLYVGAAGAQRQFTRRKQDAVCIQGGDYKRPQHTSTPCACSASDVECDYGYVAGADGACKPLPKVSTACCCCSATAAVLHCIPDHAQGWQPWAGARNTCIPFKTSQDPSHSASQFESA
jgi:hypothetical protein